MASASRTSPDRRAFSFLETAVPGATSATSGSSFASFLLGYGDSGATETVRYLPAGLPLTGASTRRTTGASAAN